MKRLLLCIAFLLPGMFLTAQERGMKPVQVTIAGASTTLYNQSHALLIGVSTYNAGLPPLPGVTTDINKVKAALEANGFNVVTVMNPDNIGLQEAFSSFIAKYGRDLNNRLLIYFAGHGYTDKMPYGNDIGYICPINAPDPNKNPSGFQEKAMPMRHIETFAYQIKSKHALFLFDACFSGTIFSTSRAIPEVISYKTKEPVRQFITSGSANETVPDKSIFRGQFIRALNGEADGNEDGFLTGTELGEFLQTTVVNYSYGSQHPQYGKIRNPNLDKGDFVFVLNKSDAPVTIVVTPTIDKKRKDLPGEPCPGMPTITDPQDGQVYPTVQIGTQCWLQNNINYETGKSWCYDNKESNCKIYGRLYNWKTALTVCPTGWHLPSDEEWTTLTDFLGGKSVAGGKMKETGTGHWKSANKVTSNSSGFTAIPGGYLGADGNFGGLTLNTYFWSSKHSSTFAWSWRLHFYDEGVYKDYFWEEEGFSCRCLQD
ncbi:MAG: caspase family protein [Bacteroidetes bacterium]|nr:caspase family protein [Bacteroidota bacterium]